MINSKALKDLFKPYELQFIGIDELINATDLSLKELLKINVEDECSRSIDESCINSECEYNFVELHENELYVEVFKEVEQKKNSKTSGKR